MAHDNKKLEMKLFMFLSFIIIAVCGILMLRGGGRPAAIGFIAGTFFFIASILLFVFIKAVDIRTASLEFELAEKNVFIREIHHRVKYNFNIMSTLINIQDEQIKTLDDAHRCLADLNSRIKSMSLIHDKLYDADDISRIDMASYFEQLGFQLKAQFPDDASQALRFESEPVFLGINTAVPCGLLVNEILFLSMSFAKISGKSLDMKVVMKEIDDGYSLLITDNGLDMRKWPAVQDVDFSIMLIHQLSGKLNAGLDISYDEGNRYLIEFDSDSK